MFETRINVSVGHALGRAEALRRTKNFLGQIKEKHADEISDLNEEWVGTTGTFSFTARGFDVSGTLNVDDRRVTMSGEGSALLRPFKGKIESILREQAQEILA
jgi:hypothetical protein